MATEVLPTRPRWGFQTSLFQWGQPSLYLYGVLVILGALLFLLEQAGLGHVSPAGWALSWGLLLPLYAAPVFLLVYRLDLYEREPLSLLIGALLWGAVAATNLAALANSLWGVVIARLGGAHFASNWMAALTAPWIEETLKYLGVVLIYQIARSEVDDELDGFVYGAMVGLGFAVVEDVFYFMAVFGGKPTGVLAGFYVRVVVSGLYSHAVYTGISGLGLGYFVSRRGEVSFGRRLAVAAALLLVAMFAHFFWNSPLLNSLLPRDPITPFKAFVQLPLALAVKGLPFLVFLVLLLRLARRRERRWLEGALATEVGREGLSPEELQALEHPRARRKAIRAMRRRAGRRAGTLLKKLYKAQISLAMIRTRGGSEADPDLARQRIYCMALRDTVRAIPSAAPLLPPPPPPTVR